MDTQPELKSSKDIIVYLSNQFPNCFTIDGDAKPLKIGIFQDLVERLAKEEQFSKTKLRVALRSYTASWRYLHCIKDGANRVDLDGNACEAITSEQAEHAQQQLKESKEKAKAKRMAENKNKPTRANAADKKAKVHTRNSSPKSKPTVKSNPAQPALQKVELSRLKIGASVKVILGSKPVPAVVSSIEKEQVKVKVSSGMELTVKADHILL
ncbi:RNA chaperone ProQ [Orbus sasakiae]